MCTVMALILPLRHTVAAVFPALATCAIAFPVCLGYYQPVTKMKAAMKPSDALALNRAAIVRVVEAHTACNVRVFGSVLHGSDEVGSDLDILIDPTSETTLFDIGAIRHELGKLLGVPVDVLTPNALPEKFRNQVLSEALPL